jgi:hypothetical protein
LYDASEKGVEKMKKTILIGSLALTLVFGVSSLAQAHDDGQKSDVMNLGRMLSHMEKMHPEMSKQQLKEMYETCHGTKGASPSRNFEMPDSGNMK